MTTTRTIEAPRIEVEATPRPWQAEGRFIKAGERSVAEVFLLPDPYLPQKANAALIVQAVNSHQALVDALQDLVAAAKALDDGLHAGLHPSGLSVERSVLYNSVNDAKSALALVGEK